MKIASYKKLKSMKIISVKKNGVITRAWCSGSNHVQSSNTWYTFYSETHHQKCRSCLCGQKTWYGDKTRHTGGGKTCAKRAYCPDCKNNYGEVSSTHSGPYTSSYSSNGDSTHTWRKKCNECNKEVSSSTSSHSGGDSATCTKRPYCPDCQVYYGKPNNSRHTGPYSSKYTSDGDFTHTWRKKCDACNTEVQSSTASHSGGGADCAGRAYCPTCQSNYGNKDPNKHRGPYSSSYTTNGDLTHTWTKKCDACNGVISTSVGNHTGGGATCTKRAYCPDCKTNYGEPDKNKHTGPYTSEYRQYNESVHAWTKVCGACKGAAEEAFAAHEKWSSGYYKGTTDSCNFLKRCGVCDYEKSFGTIDHWSGTHMVDLDGWVYTSTKYCTKPVECSGCKNREFVRIVGDHQYDGVSKNCMRCEGYNENAPVFPRLPPPSLTVAESAVTIRFTWDYYPKGCYATKIHLRKKGEEAWSEYIGYAKYGDENAWTEFVGLELATYYEYKAQNLATKTGEGVTQTHSDSKWTDIATIKTLGKPGVITWDSNVASGQPFAISSDKWYQVQRVINSWRAVFRLKQYYYYPSPYFDTHSFTLVRRNDDVDHRSWNQMITALDEISELPSSKIPSEVGPGDDMVAEDFNDLLDGINYMRQLI